MKGKRNLFKIIFLATTFSLITNTSSVYSEPVICYGNLCQDCHRVLKKDFWSTTKADDLNRCGVKFHKAGDLWNAAAAYGKSIKEDPYNPIPHYNLGNVKNKLGDQEGAIDSYTRALIFDPSDGDAYTNRGLIYIKMGNKRSACNDFMQGKYNGNKKSFKFYSKYCE